MALAAGAPTLEASLARLALVERAEAAAHPQQQEQPPAEPTPPPPLLLALPAPLLAAVLARLDTAADLACCAASCSGLREAVSSQPWEHATRLTASTWVPTLALGLCWAVVRCPHLTSIDLSGIGAVEDTHLSPLTALNTLASLSLRGCWRITGVSRAHEGSLLHHGAPHASRHAAAPAPLAAAIRARGSRAAPPAPRRCQQSWPPTRD